MATTNTRSENGAGKQLGFTPVDFDGNVEPDAAPGEYEAVIEDVKLKATSSDGYPMLVIDWKLEKAADQDDESAVKSEGATVTDFVTFMPDGERRGKMSRVQYRQLLELLGIEPDILPNKLTSAADFKDLIGALRGKTGNVFVVNREDKQTGEIRTSVKYVAPRGMGGGLAPMADEEEEEKPRGKTSKAPAGKTSKRR